MGGERDLASERGEAGAVQNPRRGVPDFLHGEVDSAPGLPGQPVRLGEARALLNPGSVGQPRDGLADAAYAVLDLDSGSESTFEFRRVRYDIDRTQRLMRDAGLPPRLAERLNYGR